MSSDTQPPAPPDVTASGATQSSIESVMTSLSGEAKQESDLADSSLSFVSGISKTKVFIDRSMEFQDIEKHWVRTHGWLLAAKDIAGEVQKRHQRGLRYLTLPATYRIDVSLLQRAGLLQTTKTDAHGNASELYVAAFESDPTVFARCNGQSPRFKLFANCSIEKAITDVESPYHAELMSLFPFDLINLDLTTSLTPKHEGPYSRTMQAITTVIKRQAGLGVWGLFLTFRNVPLELESGARDQLLQNLQSNIADYPKFRDEFASQYSVTGAANLYEKDPKLSISQAVMKWIVDQAHYFHFRVTKMNCYVYMRRPKGLDHYQIFKFIFKFMPATTTKAIIPTKSAPAEGWVEDDLVQCIKRHKPLDVETEIYKNWEREYDSLSKDVRTLCSLIS